MIIEGEKILKGEVEVPGDKSISHRAIILASLTRGTSEIENVLLSEDVYRTIEAFRAMGIKIEVFEDKKIITISGKGIYGLTEPKEDIYCGNSGTTMRLLAGLLSAQNFKSRLIGDEALSERPMDRVVEPLTKMGAKIKSNNGKAPLEISPSKLKGITYEMPIDSAQVKSAILLAGYYAKGKTEVIEKNPSRNHTELLMDYYKEVGCKSREIFVPGDISSAAFFIVSTLITEGSSIFIKDVGINPTRIGIIDVLMEMGGNIQIKNKRRTNNELIGDIYVSHSKLRGISLEKDIMGRIIDELPILAVAAAFAEGETVISGAEELRVKETDRIKAITLGLSEFGVDIEEKEDGFIIKGINKLKPAKVNSFNDHRIAMALSILALRTEGRSEVINSECVNISFPDFYEQLGSANSNLEKKVTYLESI